MKLKVSQQDVKTCLRRTFDVNQIICFRIYILVSLVLKALNTVAYHHGDLEENQNELSIQFSLVH